MISIDPTMMSERDNYKLLIGSVIPRPIAFVTSLSKDHVLNGAPFSYFNVVSSNPPMISLSIQRSKGMRKDTARNILARKEFVVHIVDESILEQVNKTAASLSPHESEIDFVQFDPIESKKISVPGVKQAKIRMECILEQSLELGGDDLAGCDLIIAKVIQFHMDSHLYEDGRIDHQELGPISRLAGANYAKIGQTIEIERPK